jgi:SAM-dependent methyltransferase
MTTSAINTDVVFSNHGFCPTCDKDVVFEAQNTWFRDWYRCSSCSSIPRERALMLIIEKYYPNWRDLSVHESSPCGRGASLKLGGAVRNYTASQFFPGFPFGQIHPSGWRNENLESQSFSDCSFDLVVTQDVMEHIFNPERAFAEIARTLKPGGAHIFTVPIVNKSAPSRVRAKMDTEGEVIHIEEAQYHGNPVDPKGSLVTMDWGYDITEFILQSSGLHSTLAFIDDLSRGIRAEYIEVVVSRKPLG